MSKKDSLPPTPTTVTSITNFPAEQVGPLLFHDYLTTRTITPKSIEACHLELMLVDEYCKIIGHKRPPPYKFCIAIPYQNGDYVTARMLGQRKAGSIIKAGTNDKGLNPAKRVSPVHIYIPPIIEWTDTLYLCESPIKAIAVCQTGLTAIAGGGVNCIYTQKSGFFEDWPHEMLASGSIKRVVILFDANAQTNPNVQAAVLALTKGIRERYDGIPIFEKQVPLWGEDEDQGIDDLLYRMGDAGVEWLHSEEGLVAARNSEFEDHLVELNARYVIVRETQNIIDRVYRRRVSRGKFVEELEADRVYEGTVAAGGKGGVRVVEKNAAKEWLKSKRRNIVEQQVYYPGREELSTEESWYNTWYDDGVLAEEGDIQPFLDFIVNAIPDAMERKPFIESLAWMRQNLESRMEKCFCLIGPEQGTGKSLTMEIINQIWGDSNCTAVSSHNFGNNFNSAIVNKQIVLLDDLVELQTNSKGLFKNFITGKSALLEHKGVDAIKVKLVSTLFITSNEFESIPMDPEDRRVHVLSYFPLVKYPQGDKYWDIFIAWLEGGGYGIIREWLEGLDVAGFNPNFMPPMTATKQHMLLSRMGTVEAWVADLHHSAEDELYGNKRRFYTINEMAIMYHGEGYGLLDKHEVISTEKHLLKHMKKWYRQVYCTAIRTVNGRKKYWDIYPRRGEATLEDVKADVRTHPNLKVVQ